jgi:hypothetical protein
MSIVMTQIQTIEGQRCITYNLEYTSKQCYIKERVMHFLLFLETSVFEEYRASVERHILEYLMAQIDKKCFFRVDIWLVQHRHLYDRHFLSPQRNMIPIGTTFKPRWKSKMRKNMGIDDSEHAEKFYSQSLNSIFGEIGT